MRKTDTPIHFREAVLELLDKFSDKYQSSLEEYLRSLWITTLENKKLEPSPPLLFSMLEKAFSTPPVQFDSQWLEYDNPLDWSYQDGEYVLETLEGTKIVIIEHNVDDFRILKHTILFQIADLYRMRDNQLKNDFRYLGVQSPTGNDWYNFDVFTYLECATSGIEDHSKDKEEPFIDCDWTYLAGLLELGRLYE